MAWFLFSFDSFLVCFGQCLACFWCLFDSISSLFLVPFCSIFGLFLGLSLIYFWFSSSQFSIVLACENFSFCACNKLHQSNRALPEFFLPVCVCTLAKVIRHKKLLLLTLGLFWSPWTRCTLCCFIETKVIRFGVKTAHFALVHAVGAPPFSLRRPDDIHVYLKCVSKKLEWICINCVGS